MDRVRFVIPEIKRKYIWTGDSGRRQYTELSRQRFSHCIHVMIGLKEMIEGGIQERNSIVKNLYNSK